MNPPLFRIDDRDLLRNVGAVRSGFLPPSVILDGLTEEHATAKPHGLPHSEFVQRESPGPGLLHAAIHSSHHLGQIVTIPQLLQLWPPAAGSMTR